MIKIKRIKQNIIKPIKPFSSIKEESDFWDTHSGLDGLNERSLVGFHQTNKTQTITIRFAPAYLQELKNKAFKRGIGPTTLARMWILQHLIGS